MLQFLLPDAILANAETLLLGHALMVARGRVHSFVPAGELSPNPRLLRFPGELWTAAPVMGHAHFESYDAPSQAWRGRGFAGWAEELIRWRMEAERLSPEESALSSVRELSEHGCGLVACHVGEPGADGRDLAAPTFPELLLMRELFEPDPAQAGEVIAKLDQRPPRPGTGIALHAPFSVSEELARAVFARGRGWNVPISIHLGEHAEERQLLAGAGGPLAELMQKRERPLKTRRWSSPVSWLEDVGGLQRGTVVVHGGDLSATELGQLASQRVAVVWCPGTHVYFDRPRPRFGAAGLRLPALGCDSRASNAILNPLRELRLARELLPEPGPGAWWEALTERGAEALGRPELGSLLPGRRARVLRLPWHPTLKAAEVCDRLSSDSDLRPIGPIEEPPFEFPEGGQTRASATP